VVEKQTVFSNEIIDFVVVVVVAINIGKFKNPDRKQASVIVTR
jgi:hypothetical protein